MANVPTLHSLSVVPFFPPCMSVSPGWSISQKSTHELIHNKYPCTEQLRHASHATNASSSTHNYRNDKENATGKFPRIIVGLRNATGVYHTFIAEQEAPQTSGLPVSLFAGGEFILKAQTNPAYLSRKKTDTGQVKLASDNIIHCFL